MNKPAFPLPVPFGELQDEDVVFDMDGTLVEGDLGETVFYHYLIRERENPNSMALPSQKLNNPILSGKEAESLRTYLGMIADGELRKAYTYTARWISTYNISDPYAITRDILAAGRPPAVIRIELRIDNKVSGFDLQLGARMKPGMHTLVRRILDSGARPWIVSASPQPVCETVGELLGIPPEHIIGVQAAGNKPRTPWGSNKVAELKKQGVIQPLLAFGDSAGDFDLLSFARHGILVHNNSSPGLLQQAQDRGWLVLHDHQPGE